MGKIFLRRNHMNKHNLKQIYLIASKFIHFARLSQNKNVSDGILNESIKSPNTHLLTNSNSIVEVEEDKKKSYVDINDLPPTLPNGQCCEEGCQNCVWLEYVIKLKFHAADKKKIKEAINLIPNSDVRAFVAFEMQKKMKDE